MKIINYVGLILSVILGIVVLIPIMVLYIVIMLPSVIRAIICEFFDWLWLWKWELLGNIFMLWVFISGGLLFCGGIVFFPAALYTGQSLGDGGGPIETFEVWFYWAALLPWIYVILYMLGEKILPIIRKELDI